MTPCEIDPTQKLFFPALHEPTTHDDHCFADFLCSSSRNDCSRAASSAGKISAGKSDASNTCRISISDSPSNGAGLRLIHSIASSFDFTWSSQNPAINSFVSANGPSITVRFVPENLTRAPLELACRPSPARRTPAFTISSLNLPIAASSSLLGRTPASEPLFALTIAMNRIVFLLCVESKLAFFPPRLDLGFTDTSNEGRLYRQPVKGFFNA